MQSNILCDVKKTYCNGQFFVNLLILFLGFFMAAEVFCNLPIELQKVMVSKLQALICTFKLNKVVTSYFGYTSYFGFNHSCDQLFLYTSDSI